MLAHVCSRALRVNLDKRIPPEIRLRFSDDNALLLADSRRPEK